MVFLLLLIRKLLQGAFICMLKNICYDLFEWIHTAYGSLTDHTMITNNKKQFSSTR